MTRTKRGIVVSVLGFALSLLPAVGEAAIKTVTCPLETIQGKLKTLKPGDTLLVNGICNENVIITEEVQNIILDGQGIATVGGPDATASTIAVRGRGITIRKFFSITSGQDAIRVDRGGTATIDNNTIQNSGRNGILVTENASARIVNNMIQNNPAHGISVSQNSSVHVGFLTIDTPAAPNTIQTNGAVGVFVGNSSNAFIVNNLIKGNAVDGIRVQQVSNARISGNTIDDNGLSGVVVLEYSGVNLGDGVAPFFDVPNDTTPGEENGDFGVHCRTGGYAKGHLGTLNGDLGDKDIETTCIDGLLP